MISISSKVKQFLVFSIKLLIVAVAFYFIYSQLAHNDKLNWSKLIELSKQKLNFFNVTIILILSFLNRFFEILKWQNLVSTIKKITVLEATKQVLASLTAGIFTPNGIGEYAGKALYYPKTQTKNIVFLNLICNGIQMIITVVFGTIGLFILGNFKIAGFIIALAMLLFVLLFVSKKIRIKGYSIEKLIENINQIPKKVHRKNIFLGLLRYVIFTHQFYFLFVIFGVSVPYITMLASKSCIYFLSSSLPSFQFLDFAIKGSVAVYYLSKFGINEWLIVFVTTFMWFLNVVLPIFIGSFYVLSFKLKTTK